MAGNPLHDLRKLSQDIERKKQQNEDNARKLEHADRESLSSGIIADKKQRQSGQKKKKTFSGRSKAFLILVLLGVSLIALVFVVKIFRKNKNPSKNVILVDDVLSHLNAKNEEFVTVTAFVNKLIKACDHKDINNLEWAPGITASAKKRSILQLKSLPSGNWEIFSVHYNEDLGFFNVICVKSENSKKLYLVLSEGIGYKLRIAKAFLGS